MTSKHQFLTFTPAMPVWLVLHWSITIKLVSQVVGRSLGFGKVSSGVFCGVLFVCWFAGLGVLFGGLGVFFCFCCCCPWVCFFVGWFFEMGRPKKFASKILQRIFGCCVLGEWYSKGWTSGDNKRHNEQLTTWAVTLEPDTGNGGNWAERAFKESSWDLTKLFYHNFIKSFKVSK